MVTHPLHNIAHHFGIEKGHGQLHQLDQEVRQDGDVNAGAHVQQNPGADKLHNRPSKKEHELRHQDEVDKVDVAVLDPDIDYRLGEKGKYELQDATCQKAQTKLEQQVFVRQYVPKQDTKTEAVALLSLLIIKSR